MSLYILRTMIVPATLAPLARSLAVGLAGEPAAGMWTTGLSPTGAEPATHYVSSGAIEDTFAGIIVDANAMYQATQAAGVDVPLETLEALVENSVITDGTYIDEEENTQTETVFQTFDRLGLKLVSMEEGTE